VAKNKLVVRVTLFFALHLVLFWVGSMVPAVERNIGLVFFVWVGIFNMMVVAQFWAFANDLYTEAQGKRLFALVGLGAPSARPRART
jgi:AAA family ATP:ADP antiporter